MYVCTYVYLQACMPMNRPSQRQGSHGKILPNPKETARVETRDRVKQVVTTKVSSFDVSVACYF